MGIIVFILIGLFYSPWMKKGFANRLQIEFISSENWNWFGDGQCFH